MSNPLVFGRAPVEVTAGPRPLAGCSIRDRSPFAAEARCEEDALLPAAVIPAAQPQQQQQQSPFVVLSAVEYERLRQRGTAEQKQGGAGSEANKCSQPLVSSTYGESLVLPELIPRPYIQVENNNNLDVQNKNDVEGSIASLRDGNSALTTASASDGISAEIPQVADEPSASAFLRIPDTKPIVPAVPPFSSTLLPALPLAGVGDPTNIEDPQGPVKPQAIGTPKALKAGRAVFSEIDERLTALQKFLRSTRESFRLMETGTLGT